MSEERKRVLEMLAEGKLNVDEAERLLAALEDDGEPEAPREPEDAGKREEEEEEEDPFDPLDGLGDEIRAGMAEAEAAVRQIVPEAVGAVKGAERIVRSVIRTTTRNRRRRSRGRGAREEAIRRFSDNRPFESGATLSVRNGKGDVKIETWERDEISFDVEIVARARTEEEAALLADSVEIDVLNAEDGIRIESSLPNEEGELRGSWVANFEIQVPKKADLDIESRHGDTRTPEIDGEVAVRNSHGHTSVGDVKGALRLRQSHGNVTVASVDSEATVEVRHGNLTLKETSGRLSLRNQHGNATIGPIGKDLDLFSAHANTTIASVGGSIGSRIRHTELHFEKDIQDNLVLDASHGAFRGRRIGGDLTVTVRHGSVKADQVEGAVAIDSSHTPVEIGRVGKDASIKSGHARVELDFVGGVAAIEGKHSPVCITEAKGDVIVNGSFDPIELKAVSGGVTISSKQGPVTVHPDGPVTDDYTINNNGGPVDLALPQGSDVEVEGNVKHGTVRCDVAGIEVTKPNKKSHRISGRMGEGSAKVRLNVERGDLSLRQS